MRLYIDKRRKECITFIILKYRIRSAASPREERENKTYGGEHEMDWIRYPDDLERYLNDTVNLERDWLMLNETFITFHLQINVLA